MRKIVAGLFMTLDGVVEAPERWPSRSLGTGVVSVTYARLRTG